MSGMSVVESCVKIAQSSVVHTTVKQVEPDDWLWE